jgi:LuxR family maltose regulon positive regulatory protein
VTVGEKYQMLITQSLTEFNDNRWKLVLEKITVPSPIACVPRPRLHALLEQSVLSCTSTIITGRAGSGKTTLAIDFAEKSGHNVAWYKVDAPESNLPIFFQYLLSSIGFHRPGFGGYSLLPLLRAEPGIHQIPLLAEHFVFELERHNTAPLLIVLEDLHLVCDADWVITFFRRLLPLLPSNVHLLITSRTIPPGPLWRMRSKQTLSVIDEDMLAFTRDEAIILFQRYGLTPEQANIALDHSRGRAATLSSLAATLHFAETAVLAKKTPEVGELGKTSYGRFAGNC